MLSVETRRAFTLIELLIVVAIIGILAAIAVPNFINARLRAQIARVQSEFRGIATAQESYMIDNAAYTDDGFRGFLIRPNAWIQLSTPVAYYNTALAIDPFKTASTPAAGDQDANRTTALYELGTGNASQPSCHGKANDYMINSLGPDSAFGAPGGGGNTGDNTVSALAYPCTGAVWRYDTSNGLHSRGDIYYFRGGAPAPRVGEVDGHPWRRGS